MYEMHGVPVRGHSLTTLTRPGFGGRAARVAAGLAGTLARFWKARRDRLHLAELDDRLLADIGVARNDIRVAIGEPRWLPVKR